MSGSGKIGKKKKKLGSVIFGQKNGECYISCSSSTVKQDKTRRDNERLPRQALLRPSRFLSFLVGEKGGHNTACKKQKKHLGCQNLSKMVQQQQHLILVIGRQHTMDRHKKQTYEKKKKRAPRERFCPYVDRSGMNAAQQEGSARVRGVCVGGGGRGHVFTFCTEVLLSRFPAVVINSAAT